MIVGINKNNRGDIDETKTHVAKYIGKPVTSLSINEPTYRLAINDFDAMGDFSFYSENTQTRGG
jgi:predicted lactoylglutathione lyase